MKITKLESGIDAETFINVIYFTGMFNAEIMQDQIALQGADSAYRLLGEAFAASIKEASEKRKIL